MIKKRVVLMSVFALSVTFGSNANAGRGKGKFPEREDGQPPITRWMSPEAQQRAQDQERKRQEEERINKKKKEESKRRYWERYDFLCKKSLYVPQ